MQKHIPQQAKMKFLKLKMKDYNTKDAQVVIQQGTTFAWHCLVLVINFSGHTRTGAFIVVWP